MKPSVGLIDMDQPQQHVPAREKPQEGHPKIGRRDRLQGCLFLPFQDHASEEKGRTGQQMHEVVHEVGFKNPFRRYQRVGDEPHQTHQQKHRSECYTDDFAI